MESFALYTFFNELGPKSSLGQQHGYFILHFFDEKGFCDQGVLEEIYSRFYDHQIKDALIGPFESLDDLQQYVHRVSQELQIKIVVLSSDEYNQCLEKSLSAEELVESMREIGQVIEDEESSSMQKMWTRFIKRR